MFAAPGWGDQQQLPSLAPPPAVEVSHSLLVHLAHPAHPHPILHRLAHPDVNPPAGLRRGHWGRHRVGRRYRRHGLGAHHWLFGRLLLGGGDLCVTVLNLIGLRQEIVLWVRSSWINNQQPLLLGQSKTGEGGKEKNPEERHDGALALRGSDPLAGHANTSTAALEQASKGLSLPRADAQNTAKRWTLGSKRAASWGNLLNPDLETLTSQSTLARASRVEAKEDSYVHWALKTMTLPLFLGVSHISLKWTFFLSMHKFCIFMHCQYAKMFFKMFTNFVAPAKCKLGRRGHDWNIAKIAKYALHKLLGKLSLHISFICPVCPTFTASGCPYIRSVDLKDHVIHLLQGKSHFPFQFEWKKASAVMAISRTWN